MVAWYDDDDDDDDDDDLLMVVFFLTGLRLMVAWSISHGRVRMPAASAPSSHFRKVLHCCRRSFPGGLCQLLSRHDR